MNMRPDAILQTLERAGFEARYVGGCVRDTLLGRPVHDWDIASQALPEDVLRLFPRCVPTGLQHGTVTVLLDGTSAEVTTYRLDGTYHDSRHPDGVRFVRSLADDLARRDFTINAMAYSPVRGYADPFGGREDLEKKVLRAVGDPAARFREDSLRILRGVRFAVKYGLAVEEQTQKAMLSQAHLMDNLARERVFSELCKLLPLVTAGDLRRFAPILARVIPELEPMIGFDQHSPHHAYDLFTHTVYVTENVSDDLTLRWAALLHDIGKVPTFTRDDTGRGHFYGHAPRGGEMAEQVLRRLKAPNALREEAVTLISHHMTKIPPTKKAVRRILSRLGWDTTQRLLCLQKADMSSKGVDNDGDLSQFSVLQELLEEIRQENACLSLKDLAVNGRDLMALGIRGKSLGQTLAALLDQVLEETLPNEKIPLLEYARQLNQEESP